MLFINEDLVCTSVKTKVTQD